MRARSRRTQLLWLHPETALTTLRRQVGADFLVVFDLSSELAFAVVLHQEAL